MLVFFLGAMFLSGDISPPDVDIYSETMKIDKGFCNPESPTTAIMFNTIDAGLSYLEYPMIEAGAGHSALIGLTNTNRNSGLELLSDMTFADVATFVKNNHLISQLDSSVYFYAHNTIDGNATTNRNNDNLRVSNDRTVRTLALYLFNAKSGDTDPA